MTVLHMHTSGRAIERLRFAAAVFQMVLEIRSWSNVCFPSLGPFRKLQRRTATAQWRGHLRACRAICKQRFYDNPMKEN